jgi:hypothetical protein
VYADGDRPAGNALPPDLKSDIAMVRGLAGEIDGDGLEPAAGGSVTAMICDVEVAVSPEVILLAVTVSVATGWPVPV